MFVKLTVLACSLGVAFGVWTGPLAGGVPASQFPAGVSPQACPNYPNCNNPALSANPSAPAPYNPAPQYNPYNSAPVPQYNAGLQGALDRGEYVGDGDYHGEGLAEALAPGYAGQNNGQWNNNNNNNGAWQGQNQGQWQAQPQWQQPQAQWQQPQAALPHGVPAQIPAGVDARSCPNYPFCHS